MTDEEQIDRLNQLADRLFCPDVPTFVGNDHPPFDIKPVNLHESKKEFLEEFRTVSTIVDHLQGVIGLLELSPDATEPLRDARIRRVQIAVDGAFRQGFRTQKMRVVSANDLVVQNFRETGFFVNSLSLFSDMIFAYKMRLTELKDQEKEFWSSSNRAPDHFARIIALRFARLFARHTGKRPTFGTSGDGGHPSTKFGRSLEEVFAILSIRRSPRSVAPWAIDQLIPEDWLPAFPKWPVLGAIRPPPDAATV